MKKKKMSLSPEEIERRKEQGKKLVELRKLKKEGEMVNKEESKVEEQKEPVVKTGQLKCKRCGFEFTEAVIRLGKKVCPNCFAPLDWKN